MRSIEWWHCRWPKLPPFSAFCTAIHSVVTGEPRDFKFGTLIYHSKSHPVDEKSTYILTPLAYSWLCHCFSPVGAYTALRAWMLEDRFVATVCVWGWGLVLAVGWTADYNSGVRRIFSARGQKLPDFLRGRTHGVWKYMQNAFALEQLMPKRVVDQNSISLFQ